MQKCSCFKGPRLLKGPLISGEKRLSTGPATWDQASSMTHKAMGPSKKVAMPGISVRSNLSGKSAQSR